MISMTKGFFKECESLSFAFRSLFIMGHRLFAGKSPEANFRMRLSYIFKGRRMGCYQIIDFFYLSTDMPYLLADFTAAYIPIDFTGFRIVIHP